MACRALNVKDYSVQFCRSQSTVCKRKQGRSLWPRLAASEGRGAVFAPLAMGGAGGLRASGRPADRLTRWLDGMETACLSAIRHLDDVEVWAARAEAEMTSLSGRTPQALRAVLTEWPLVSAPMAETVTGASRAAVQRNLAWMEARHLIREVTGQGRYRMWRIVEAREIESRSISNRPRKVSPDRRYTEPEACVILNRNPPEAGWPM